MTRIVIQHALKKYGEHTVIPDLSVEMSDGGMFTLLGPSGCGKTTLLRMIAGFNSIEGGDFYFDDERINDKDVTKRNIGMVFQNYAIFPHLTVRENVAFGLKQRTISKAEIEERTDKFLGLMQIKEYADRLPEKLSGGQQQRVALARALVIEPNVLLMDEPLSNLDAKLRLEMRETIRNIQKEVGITTVYVTHDQEEAMAISDQIAVMKDGVIQHLGTPEEIYHRPANIFVATFIGRTNLLDAYYDSDKKLLRFNDGYELPYNKINVPSQKVLVSIRPEDFVVNTKGLGMKAFVNDAIFLGQQTHFYLELETKEKVEIIRESSYGDNVIKEDEIYMEIRENEINVYDESGAINYLNYEKQS